MIWITCIVIGKARRSHRLLVEEDDPGADVLHCEGRCEITGNLSGWLVFCWMIEAMHDFQCYSVGSYIVVELRLCILGKNPEQFRGEHVNPGLIRALRQACEHRSFGCVGSAYD